MHEMRITAASNTFIVLQTHKQTSTYILDTVVSHTPTYRIPHSHSLFHMLAIFTTVFIVILPLKVDNKYYRFNINVEVIGLSILSLQK